MNNACSTFKCSVTKCFKGETLRLLTLPTWEEHPYSVTAEKARNEGLNPYLHTRRVWYAACLHLSACAVHSRLRVPPGAKAVSVQSPAFGILAEAENLP